MQTRATVCFRPAAAETAIANVEGTALGEKLTEPHLVVLLHIISQLRPGADLSRVTLPTFILEPRSMLERITKCVRLTHERQRLEMTDN